MVWIWIGFDCPVFFAIQFHEDIVRDPLQWTFVDIWRTLRDYRDSLKPIAFWLALSWTSIWKYFALQHFAMPRSWAIQTCDIGAWATWNVEVICLPLRHCDFLPQDCLTERGYVRLIPTLGTWKTQVLDKPSVDVLFKCMCNSQAISDLLPSAYPGHCRLQTARIRRQKKNTCFNASLLRCVQLKNKCFGNLMCWFYLVLRGCPSFCRWEDLRDWQLCGSGVAFGENEDEIERNSHWKWCSDIGIIFKSFSISTSILQVVQPSPKVKIGFQVPGLDPLPKNSFPAEHMAAHVARCWAEHGWNPCVGRWRFYFFFKKSGTF